MNVKTKSRLGLKLDDRYKAIIEIAVDKMKDDGIQSATKTDVIRQALELYAKDNQISDDIIRDRLYKKEQKPIGLFFEQNADIQEILESHCIFQQQAIGKITNGKLELKANLGIYQLYNGKVIIRAELSENLDLEFVDILTQLEPGLDKTFALEGQTDDGWLFEIKRAFIISCHMDSNSQSPISCLFRIHIPEHLILRYNSVDNNNQYTYNFAVTNVINHIKFQIQLDDWSIAFRNQPNNNMEDLMRYTRLPMVTGYITIKPVCNNNVNMETMQKIVREVTYMMSLAESSLVSITNMQVINSQDNIVEIHLLEHRVSPPLTGSQLINIEDAESYMDCVLPNFHFMSNEDRKKILIAIEYLLVAKRSEPIEERLLNGITALELLSGHISGQNHQELRNIAPNVRKKVRCSLVRCLNEMFNDLDPNAYSKLTEAINGIFDNWINLQDKVEKTLEELNINISDLKTSLKRIIEIRNKLIHGRDFYEINFGESLQASKDLLAMLDRVILSKINYHDHFNDFHDKLQRRSMNDIRTNNITSK